MKNNIFIIFLTTLLIIFSCNTEEDKKTNINDKDTLQKNEEDNILSIEKFYFAADTPTGKKEITTPVYQRGEEVVFVIENVGKFEFDDEGKNRIELHMKVEDQTGMPVGKHRNILGEKGHIKTKNGYVKNPYAKFKTYKKDAPGTYTFNLTVVDLLKGDSVTVISEYFLE